MSIRTGPGPRLPPPFVRTSPTGCDPCARPAESMTLAGPEAAFEVVSCHSSRDGFAAITLRDSRTGATMTLQKVPFAHDYDEDFEHQCQRIQVEARKIVQNMAEAMAVKSAERLDA